MIQEALENYVQTSRSQSEFQTQVNQSWEETKKLYPDVANPQSKLYVRANEILFERGLAKVDDGSGQVQLLTPFAYRIAVEAASAELSRQAPQEAQAQTRKSQAGAVQGRASNFSPKGKLTYDQYSRLSDEEKDAYDRQQR